MRWTISREDDEYVLMLRGSSLSPGTTVEVMPVPDDAAVERIAEEMASWSGPVPGGVDGFRPYAKKVLAALEDQ